MIDRKTFGLLILFCFLTAAAAVWRLSQLPDWTHVTFIGDQGPHTKSGLFFFIAPLSLLFMIAIASGTKLLVAGPDDSVKAHQRLSRLTLLGTGVLTVIMQAFMVSRSFGVGLSLNGEVFARATIVITAILIIVQGNTMPKLPWIASRFPRFQLDAWQQARAKRFAGRLSIAYGLAMIAAAATLPVKAVAVIVFALCALYIGVIVWNGLRLRREAASSP